MARVRNNKVVKSSSGASHGPICRTLATVRERCWDWSDVAQLSTYEMAVLLYGSPPIPGATATLLDWPEVDAQLHRPILTLLPRQEGVPAQTPRGALATLISVTTTAPFAKSGS